MNGTLKKAISLLLVVVVLFAAAPLSGFVGLNLPEINLFSIKAKAATDGYYTYTVSNGEATITGVDTSISGDIAIPSTLGGYPITKIESSAFIECSKLTSITIPDNVTSIGHYAFAYCYSLTSVAISDSVTSIGAFAFYNCSKIISIIIPNSVTSIGENAFGYCYSLENITISESLKSISNGMFGCCSRLTSVTILGSITSIGNSAFTKCTNLTNITIPESVRSIGVNAFCGCSSLEEIIIPYNCSDIGVSAFEDCSNLSKIYIYNKNCSIYTGAIPLCSTVYGYAGSSAERYAGNYGHKFALIDNLCEHTYSDDCDTLCNICGERRKNAHNYGEWTVTKEATCNKTGSKERICLECGHCDKEIIQVTEHKAGEWQTVINPTVTSFGKKIQRCLMCGDILAEEMVAKVIPPEAIVDKNVISYPSTTTISYGDGIILHIGDGIIPEGGRVVWTADNDNFTKSISSNGTICTITPNKSGDTIFTATIYDSKGNPILTDEQVMTSKAGFFDKLIAFFKKLFGATKVIPQVFKGIF